MITSLRLKNFKNFADETLRMGPFTVIVGANASGKSNIRDAFRFLHGIGRGYRLADIVGGKYGAGGQVEWEPIRGAADEIIRLRHSVFELRVQMETRRTESEKHFAHADLSELATGQPILADYKIRVSRSENSGRFGVAEEEFNAHGRNIYTSRRREGNVVLDPSAESQLLLQMSGTGARRQYKHPLSVKRDQPALTQISEHKSILRPEKQASLHGTAVLHDMRFLDLAPNSLQQPAFPGQTILGDSGENLPTVLKEICEDPSRRKNLIEWTRELTPMDVEDFEFPTDRTTGRIQLALKETNGRTVSAYSASDGTLRFLAMLAALLGGNPAGLYVFEEIDNGIHPSRLRLLIDLIEQQTAKGDIQVVTTTHSPELLSMISDETFKHTSVVCRSPDTDNAVIRPIADLPDADKLRKSQGLGRLHTGGWLENAVWFSENIDQDDGSST